MQKETISEGEDGRGVGGRSLAAGSTERGETGILSGINHPLSHQHLLFVFLNDIVFISISQVTMGSTERWRV